MPDLPGFWKDAENAVGGKLTEEAWIQMWIDLYWQAHEAKHAPPQQTVMPPNYFTLRGDA